MFTPLVFCICLYAAIKKIYLTACLKHSVMAKYVKAVFYFWFNGSLNGRILRVWWSLPEVIEPAEKFLWHTAIKSKCSPLEPTSSQSHTWPKEPLRKKLQTPNFWAAITTACSSILTALCCEVWTTWLCHWFSNNAHDKKWYQILHRTCGISSLLTQFDEHFAVLNIEGVPAFLFDFWCSYIVLSRQHAPVLSLFQ